MVYLDEMFLFNAFMDYILLRLCASVCISRYKKYRLILSAALGGFFSCIGYVLELPLIFGLLFAVLCSLVAFGLSGKECVVLGILSACYSGGLSLLSKLIGSISKNGFGYISFSPLLLIILSFMLYFPVKYCFFLYNKKNSEVHREAMILTSEGTVKLTVLIDSGCLLSCNGNPVMIVSKTVYDSCGNIPVSYAALGSNGMLMCRYMSGFVGERYYNRIAVGSANICADSYQGIFPQYAL